MLCPNCESPLHEITLHGETVDQCNACNGVWFDERELSAALRRIQSATTNVVSTAHPLQHRDCPRCSAGMSSAEYAYDSGITISRCDQCSGVWLDHGQLERIAHARAGTPQVNALADAHSAELRTSRRWAFFHDAIRSRRAAGAIALLYIVAALAFRGPETAMRIFGFVLLPLLCIWFPDGLGKMKGIALGFGTPAITHTTPGAFVAIGGWLLLLCPPVVVFLLR